MKRRTPAIVWVMGSFLVLFALLCAGLLYFSQTAAAIGAGLWLAMLVSFLAVVLSDRRRVRDAARWFTQALDPQQKKTVEAFPLPAAAVSGTGELLLYNARFDEQFLGGGIVDETQSDTAFFRCIVDNLLRAYLSKRAARDTHGNAFQQGRLAGPVRLLGLIVPVIAENQCRHALPQHVGQRTEGAEIFGFYRL